jgi:hypothetical protein
MTVFRAIKDLVLSPPLITTLYINLKVVNSTATIAVNIAKDVHGISS